MEDKQIRIVLEDKDLPLEDKKLTLTDWFYLSDLPYKKVEVENVPKDLESLPEKTIDLEIPREKQIGSLESKKVEISDDKRVDLSTKREDISDFRKLELETDKVGLYPEEKVIELHDSETVETLYPGEINQLPYEDIDDIGEGVKLSDTRTYELPKDIDDTELNSTGTIKLSDSRETEISENLEEVETKSAGTVKLSDTRDI